MKIQDKTSRFFPVKMQSIDTNPRLNIKKIFFEGDVISEFEILPQLFRLENKFLLEKIYDQ